MIKILSEQDGGDSAMNRSWDSSRNLDEPETKCIAPGVSPCNFRPRFGREPTWTKRRGRANGEDQKRTSGVTERLFGCGAYRGHGFVKTLKRRNVPRPKAPTDFRRILFQIRVVALC